MPRVSLRLAAAVTLLWPGSLRGQGGPIAGVVLSRSTGGPVADAQVAVAGTTLRALSDAAGRFHFNDVPGATAVLQTRRIGYSAVTDTVRVGDTNVRIFLEQKALELEQTVVTGQPIATAQRALGIAVSRIDAASVTQTAPISDVQSLLNGRAAGVLIQPATGAVGSGSRIRIRGASSFSIGNQPLVYVDGVRVDADFASGPTNQAFGSSSISRYNDFNPDDIESVEIVKGPAATTLYGTEASNGVIQIITKRGTTGPAHWDFTLRQGVNYFSNPQGRFPTNYQVNSQGNLVSITLRDLESQVGDIFRTGHLADYQASVSGWSAITWRAARSCRAGPSRATTSGTRTAGPISSSRRATRSRSRRAWAMSRGRRT
jgi:TonB-dependent SusC/RagA subfamily outer membrane receptor